MHRNLHLAVLNITSIEALASYENGNKDDEKDVCTIQACENGTTCECTICESSIRAS